MKRLTPATLTFGVMAIMGLLVSAYVVRTLLARDDKPPAVTTRNMPTPVADIPEGTEITAKHLGSAPTLVSSLTPDMLANNSVIVGRVAREALKKAVPIKANQLYAPGERPPLKLAKGMKALTISLTSNTAIVDGLIKPGDYCDIQLTVNTNLFADNRIPNGYQLTLFKGIKVLAINRNTVQQDIESNGNTVTLEVRPGQANAILLAEKNGTLILTYTSSSTPGGIQVSDADDDRLTMEKLLDLPPKPQPEQPKPPEPFTVDEYRHLRRGTVGFLPNGRILDLSNGYGTTGYGAPWYPTGGAPTGTNPSGSTSGSPVAPPTPNSTPTPQAPTTPNGPPPPQPPNNGGNGAPVNQFAPGQPTALNAYPQNFRGQ